MMKRLCAALLVLIFYEVQAVELHTGLKKRDASSYDAYYDFKTSSFKDHPNVVRVENFEGSACSTRGVLKITLSKDDVNKRRLVLDFDFENPSEWTFNLGDSRTNNGWAGDASSQSRDAEVQGNTNAILGHFSDNGGSGLAFNIQDLYRNHLTLVAGDEHLVWIADNDPTKTNYFSSPGWYALNGQSDHEGPVNYDLYLGINRVISGGNYDGRVGSGLCRVGIKFLPAV
ncbi:unnamed protein product [Lymnaea stagnalis]|uniref:Uncharacterized protein n=1 Tax=Lymnaea stagnalis TaxID=6523 RepID=A0AAV2GXM3_LYMST